MARWKDIDGYEGLYLVSDDGRIYSLPKMKRTNKGEYFQDGRILKPSKKGKCGIEYEQVKLCKDGVQKTFPVHRLVAIAFVENDNPELYDVVNHKDRNSLNNNCENLEWCDQSYNNGYSHNKRIEQWHEDRKLAEYASIKIASTITGIKERSISNALCGWSKSAGGFVWKYCIEEDE